MRLLMVTTALAALLLPALPIQAEEAGAEVEGAPEGWRLASDINLTLTQNAYSENWDGEETGALSWALNSNSIAENQLSETLNSKSTLKLAFGQTHRQDKETKDWQRPDTTTDLIDFESVLRFHFGWVVDPYVSGRVESHFVDTRDPERTRSLNPTVFTESVGVARVFIKEEDRELTARLGGAIRQHVDRYAYNAETEETESEETTDSGLELVSELRTPLLDGAVGFTSDLRVFQAVYYSESEDLTGEGKDDWKSPDVDWKNTFTAEITEYINVNLFLQALYDKQVDDGIRLKETLSLGFTLDLL